MMSEEVEDPIRITKYEDLFDDEQNNGDNVMIIYHIWELHNGFEPRLRMAYVNKRTAYTKVVELNNREKKNNSNSKYYIKEFEVYED